MNHSEIQKMVQLMEKSSLSELSVKEKDFEITLKKGGSSPTVLSVPSVAPSVAADQTSSTPLAKEEAKDIFVIKAPMIGSFYASSSPESEPYVQEGSVVRPDSVVCILEAMKVMNEIRAECSGKIIEVLVKNGAPVEYGQPLFTVQLSA
ncbi:MAG: acetyl-CoA carboxylase biotin carboxyl carrier protein [Opitutales bacterium]|nr:acetyl-CoA carboxylase biotin carboxyl carrier protein [Opitutales bacterium]